MNLFNKFLIDLRFFYKMQLAFFIILIFSFKVQAVTADFPEEKSAATPPLMDTPSMALNIDVPLKWRAELNLSLLDQRFYHLSPQGRITLNITEAHAFSLLGTYYIPDSHQMTQISLARTVLTAGTVGGNTKDLKANNNLSKDLSKGLFNQMSVFLNYRYTPVYINFPNSFFSTYHAFAGAGAVVSNQNDIHPALNMGMGQNFYFTKRLFINIDLSVLAYYGKAMAPMYAGFSANNKQKNETLKSREKTLNFSSIVSFGLSFLL